jgi:response regulator RpfG family c-di-GMP phosphodiesterase
MEQYLRILFIEDSEDDRQLVLRELKRNDMEIVSERVETADAMRKALADQEWDLVISDYSMPSFNAPEALSVLQASDVDLPFIIISGTIGEETAVAALKAGAHDFLVKGNLARLIPAIQRELRDARIRREHRQAEESLREKERLVSEAQRIGHVGSWSYDIASDTFQYSDEMYRLLDVSPEEFKHSLDGFLNLVYSADRPLMAKWMDEIKAGRRPKELDFRVFHKNSELRYIQGRGAPVFDTTSDEAVRVIGTAHDITERKLAEIQIRQQIARLTALSKIDRAIMSSFELRVTLGIVLSETLEQLQVDAADILLLHPDGQILEYSAGRGFNTNKIEASRVHIGDSLARRVVMERRVIRIENLNDQKAEHFLAQLLIEERFVWYIGVPLITKGKVNGVLEIFHRSPLQPYPEWYSFLETLAGQAAIAIDNATLFDNLQRSNFELELAYDATIEGWSRALDLRDKETEGHTQRVTQMSLRIAHALSIPEEQLIHIHRGGLLHDIGKMGVPDSILLKPGPLTEDERDIMRQHPKLAYDWLAPITFLQKALEIPYCHHEKWDGTGYPRGLKGEQTPLSARIFAVADVWDALTNDRPYRKAWSNEEALKYIRENNGTHFDPQVVEVFLDLFAHTNP